MAEYPESKALAEWNYEGARCSIVRVQDSGHLCGYARFPRRFVREDGYDGILSFVPVHGGITYARESDDGTMVYGFDCAHSGDAPPIEFASKIGLRHRNPGAHVWTEDEVHAETERMVRGIAACEPYEERYLLARDGEERAAVIDEYHAALGGGFDVTDNFGAMIGVLGGLRKP